jgi:hypothetical protein
LTIVARRVYTEEALRRLDDDPRYQRVRPQDVHPDDTVGARPVHAVSGTGMDGFEVDLAELARTERELAGVHDILQGYMNQSAKLTGPLRDGHSPVADHMRRAFFERADLDGGLQQALREYMRELFTVRRAILATLNSYQALDADAVARLDRQISELDGGNS